MLSLDRKPFHFLNSIKVQATSRQRLDELGFIWDERDADWEEGFSHLKMYRDRVGHCRVPQHHKEDGFPLGAWVSRQRQNKANLSLVRRQRLDEVGFIWDEREADWEEGFNYLKLERRERLNELGFVWKPQKGPVRSTMKSSRV
jgi:hypothetical protein